MLMQGRTEIKMSDITPTFHKLTGFGDGYVFVEGPSAGDATFVESENGFVIGLPGGLTVNILHETLSRAHKGVSENEEDNGLDDDAKAGDEQGVEPELIVGDHGAEVKIKRELVNHLDSSSDEEEEDTGAEQVETERGVVDLTNISTIDLTADSDSEYSTDDNLSVEEDYNESQE
jgi:hypothetical protein